MISMTVLFIGAGLGISCFVLLRMVDTVKETTERKHLEQRLHKYSRSVEQSPVSVVITDINGDIEYVNPKFTEVTGYSFDEVRGQNPRILKSGKTQTDEYRALWKAITSGEEWRGEFQNRKKNGELYWETASISPITDEAGTIISFLAVKEDITERKRLEQQLLQAQKLEGMGTLAGGIAHDFNNLLAVILGSAELLQRRIADQPELKKYVDRIIEASEQGTSISRQLLIFSRPDLAKLMPVSLSHTILELQEMLRHFLPKSITIETSMEIDRGIIMGDAGQIHQALLNLALNAGDAMANHGTLTINVFSVSPEFIQKRFLEESSVSYVAVSVNDTGGGIEEAVMGKMFDPFFSTKERGKGTGLGLAMVHGIMKNHHGFIDVESTVGIGTTFTLYFPAVMKEVEETAT